jgi:hypothetical protein
MTIKPLTRADQETARIHALFDGASKIDAAYDHLRDARNQLNGFEVDAQIITALDAALAALEPARARVYKAAYQAIEDRTNTAIYEDRQKAKVVGGE